MRFNGWTIFLILAFCCAGGAVSPCFSDALGREAAEGQAAPQSGGEIREAAVAGVFYSEDPAQLRAKIAECRKESVENTVPGRVRALVSPHAGYRYSGPVAMSGYRLLQPGIKKVMIIAASHHERFFGASIPEVAAYRTPLGDIPLAPEADAIRLLPGFGYRPEAHDREHSLEVQLPLLQTVLGHFELIPIVVSMGNPGNLAQALLPFVDDQTLVVASTDLSHYFSYKKATALDALCSSAVPDLDFSRMDSCQACGKKPVLTLMRMAAARGWKGQLLDCRNSGDTAGPMRQVVGYMSVAFYQDPNAKPPVLNKPKKGVSMESKTSPKDREDLLVLARTAIESKLLKDREVQRPAAPSDLLEEKHGCFVTLHKHGQLRGCIGTIEPVERLKDCVEQNAVNAAFRDPRFPVLSSAELKEVDIEVSVLSNPARLEYDGADDLLAKLRPNVHGVILSKGARRATFLPQVWEQLPNPEMFLINLCQKAGLTPNAWRDPDTRVEVYTVEHFEEPKGK